MSFLHRAHPFFTVFTKGQEFVQNSVFSPRFARFGFFALGAPLFSVFRKVHEFVENSVSSAKSARFVTFALGTTLFSGFEQIAGVCTEQRFQPEISTFC